MIALGLGLGCNPVSLPAIEIDDVQPGYAYSGEQKPVEITGRGFFPRMKISANSGVAEVDDEFEVMLVKPGGTQPPVPLVEVQLLGFDRLGAWLPEGIPVEEDYDVVVIGPGGDYGTLPDGFSVFDTKPTRIGVDILNEGSTFPVNTAVWVELKVLDLEDRQVEFPVEVVITATDSLGLAIPEVLYTVEELDNVRLTPDKDGIIGIIREGKVAIMVLREVSGRVKIDVAPLESKDLDIAGGEVELVFRENENYELVFDALPPSSPPEGYVAGVPIPITATLVGGYGSRDGETVLVSLVTDCTRWHDEIAFEVDRPTTFELVGETACEGDRIYSDSSHIEGWSERFAVVAGEAASFDFNTISPNPVVAGELVTVSITPLDAWGNRTSYGGALTIGAPDAEPVDPKCYPSNGAGLGRVCTFVPTRAGNPVLTVVDVTGLRVGQNGDLVVHPQPDPMGATVTVPPTAIAGQAFLVGIQPTDRYGNPIDASGQGASYVTVSDDQAEVVCTDAPPAGTSMQLSCRLFTSRANARLSVTFRDTRAVVPAPVMSVVPGPFARVSVVAPVQVTAGDVIAVVVTPRDDWGNQVPAPPGPLQGFLSDTAGSFPGRAVWLHDSPLFVNGAFQVAGTTTLVFELQGQTIGRSNPVEVLPAPAVAWQVDPGPWAFTGVPVPVEVRARDAWGNTPDVDTTLSVTSSTGSVQPMSYPVTGGMGVLMVTFDRPSTVETLQVRDQQGISGSAPLPVVSACVDGPSADAVLIGAVADRVCLDPMTGFGSVRIDVSGSMAVAAPLELLAVAVDGQRQALGAFPAAGGPTVSFTEPGHPSVEVLVADRALCGDVVALDAWVGPDDGTPTGPVTVTTARPSVSVAMAVDFDIADVTDCAGVPAAGQALFFRSGVGTVTPTVSTAPTGRGWQTELDAAGSRTVEVVTGNDLQYGRFTVQAYTDSGSAEGHLELAIDSDTVAPVVVEQLPSGSVDVPALGEVLLWFSEQVESPDWMRAIRIVEAQGAPVPVQGIEVDAEGMQVRLDLGSVLTQGDYDVFVDQTVTDSAGNPISGNYSGAPWDYDGAFTFVDLGSPLVDCDTNLDRFRPDGDPGLDIEADEVEIDVAFAPVPRWWLLDVTDEEGTLVRHLRRPAVAISEVVAWDGRASTGALVPDGVYTLYVGAEDAAGHRGVPCVRSVRVAQGPRDVP